VANLEAGRPHLNWEEVEGKDLAGNQRKPHGKIPRVVRGWGGQTSTTQVWPYKFTRNRRVSEEKERGKCRQGRHESPGDRTEINPTTSPFLKLNKIRAVFPTKGGETAKKKSGKGQKKISDEITKQHKFLGVRQEVNKVLARLRGRAGNDGR